MSWAIQAENLGKRYAVGENASLFGFGRQRSDYWAVRAATFTLNEGEVLGIIGRNGAGKSTLLKMLARITRPSEGRARLRGRVGSLLEVGTGFHPDLTGRENIFLSGALLGMSQQEIARKLEAIVEFAGVADFIDTPVKRYSSGMTVRLGFAVAAHIEPEILVVDEVLAVGDLAFQRKCLGQIEGMSRHGRTVLFVSHSMAAIEQLTQRCLVLDGGHIAFDGATKDAVQRYAGLKESHMWRGRKPAAQIACDRRWRSNGGPVWIEEVGLAPDQSEAVPVGGALALDILLASSMPLDGARLGYSINSRAGSCLLSGLSEPLDIRARRGLYRLEIGDLALAPGEYDLSLSLGLGGWPDPKNEMDCLMGFGRVEIVDRFADGRPFGSWYSEWAPALHRNCRIAAIPERETISAHV